MMESRTVACWNAGSLYVSWPQVAIVWETREMLRGAEFRRGSFTLPLTKISSTGGIRQGGWMLGDHVSNEAEKRSKRHGRLECVTEYRSSIYYEKRILN